ncbi:MAG: CdaR family protein [Gemella sp.]|nr:CdaR family protein [Gemella sp.]
MDKQKIGLHIISLFTAIFLFLSVNENFLGRLFPATSANYTTNWVRDIPVEVNYDKEKLYVLGIPDSVDVKLTGPTAIVQKEALDRTLKAKLDFSNISSGSEQNIKVDISDLDSNITAVANPEFISVSVREKISKDFPVKTSIRDERLLVGTGINSVTAVDQTIKIYGAAESINNIYEVRAESSERTKISADKSEEATLVAYDRNFNRIEDIEFEKNTTTLNIKVDKIEKSLPIKAKEIGNLPDNRQLESITIEPSTAIIKAQNKSDLDTVREIFVDVELSNIKEDTVELSNLKVYHNHNNSAIIDPNNVKVTIKTKAK